MKNIFIRAAIGLSIMGSCLAVAAPASAASRLRNAYTSQGTFYLGVSGGNMSVGTPLIVWQAAGSDQYWNLPDNSGYVWDNVTSNGTFCIDVQGDPNGGLGAGLIIQRCNSTSYVEETWQLIPAAKVGFGANYPGCYLFWNVNKGMAMGVAGGNTSLRNGTRVILWTWDTSANQFWCPA